MNNALIKAHLALLAVNIIYGANYVVAKDVMPAYLNPISFVMARILGALVMFWILNRFVGLDKVKPKDFIRLLFCGLFGVALNQLFFFEGLSMTSPVNAAIIMPCTPIIVVVLSFFILKESLSRNRLIGISLGLAGALGVILIGAFSDGKDINANGLGDLFILINATSYALYLVLVKPLMKRYSPLTVISYVFLFGSAFVVPYAFSDFTAQNWEMPTDIYVKIAFVVICVTFLAYLLNIFALKTVSPAVSSSYIYLQPLLSLLFTWMHDEITGGNMLGTLVPLHAVFALMIVAGVYITSREARKA